MPKYSPKHFVVEARQMTGTTAEMHDIYKWVEENTQGSFDLYDGDGVPYSGVSIDPDTGYMVIADRGWLIDVKPGCWVIRGVEEDRFYTCNPQTFERAYVLVED